MKAHLLAGLALCSLAGCDSLFSTPVEARPRYNPVLHAVTSDGAGFFGVGEGGSLFRVSAPGEKWEIGSTQSGRDLFAVHRDDSGYLAAGAGATIYTSVDTITWTVWGFTQAGAGDFTAIETSPGRSVIVGQHGYIATSSDRTFWQLTRLGSPQEPDLVDVAFGANTFIAVADDGTSLVSADGVSWTTAPMPEPACAIVYGVDAFVAFGQEGTISTSPNGIGWTEAAVNAYAATTHCDADFNGQMFVFVDIEGEILISTDTSSWESVSYEGEESLLAADWNDGELVVVGEQGAVLETTCSEAACEEPSVEHLSATVPESPEPTGGGGDPNTGNGGGTTPDCTCYCQNGSVCTSHEQCGVDELGIQNVCGCPVDPACGT